MRLGSNLLVRERSQRRLFGIQVDERIARDVVLGLLIGVLVAAVAIAGFVLRLSALHTEAAGIEAQNDATAVQRAQIQVILNDVQTLQRVDRQASWIRQSGQVEALRLAELGNTVSEGAWFDDLVHDQKGWTISGGGPDLTTINHTFARIARVSPGLQTSLAQIDNAQHRFRVTIGSGDVFSAAPVSATR